MESTEDIRLSDLLQDHPQIGDYLVSIAGTVNTVGTDRFEASLIAFLSEVVPIDHCAVFTYSAAGDAGHLFTHSRMPAAEAEELARDYVEKYHRDDPNFEHVQTSTGEDYHSLAHRDLSDDYDPAYLNHFFDRTGLIDKASSVGRVENGKVYCNFYRMRGSDTYSNAEWQALEYLMPLATALTALHYDLAYARGTLHLDNGSENIVRKSIVHNAISTDKPPFDALTKREREVCERILLGYTSTGIGLDLGIAPTSVATYRKRAYSKLGISSQNELFTVCLKLSGQF